MVVFVLTLFAKLAGVVLYTSLSTVVCPDYTRVLRIPGAVPATVCHSVLASASCLGARCCCCREPQNASVLIACVRSAPDHYVVECRHRWAWGLRTSQQVVLRVALGLSIAHNTLRRS